jgi:hypothetical protein
MDAAAQSTIPLAVTNSQTTVTLVSAAGFTAPASGQQFSVVILDSGNPAYVAASPLATPYEYQQVNNVTGNVLTFGPGGGSAARSSYAGTTPKAFFAGATIAATPLAEDFAASVPWKIDDQSPSAVTNITIPKTGVIPSGFSRIRISWKIRSTVAATNESLVMQFNGDTAAHYDYELQNALSGAVSSAGTFNATSMLIGHAPGASIAAGVFATGWVEIMSYTDVVSRKAYTALAYRNSDAFGVDTVAGDWQTTSAAITTILIGFGGQFVTGSRITTELYP